PGRQVCWGRSMICAPTGALVETALIFPASMTMTALVREESLRPSNTLAQRRAMTGDVVCADKGRPKRFTTKMMRKRFRIRSHLIHSKKNKSAFCISCARLVDNPAAQCIKFVVHAAGERKTIGLAKHRGGSSASS